MNGNEWSGAPGTRGGGYAPRLTALEGNWNPGFSFLGIPILLETVPQTKVGVGVVLQLSRERHVVAEHDVRPRAVRVTASLRLYVSEGRKWPSSSLGEKNPNRVSMSVS